MLYQLHEMNRTMLNPLIQWAEASSNIANATTGFEIT
jgi:poly-beta-hydroxyalkanoate depolymerase